MLCLSLKERRKLLLLLVDSASLENYHDGYLLIQSAVWICFLSFLTFSLILRNITFEVWPLWKMHERLRKVMSKYISPENSALGVYCPSFDVSNLRVVPCLNSWLCWCHTLGIESHPGSVVSALNINQHTPSHLPGNFIAT